MSAPRNLLAAAPAVTEERLSRDAAPVNMANKYNLVLMDGDWVYVMLDKNGLPLGPPIPAQGNQGARNALARGAW